MSTHYDAVRQQAKMLSNLEKWLDKAEAYAAAKSFDVGVLLSARLAPDQFPLLKQIQIACDWGKNGASRFAGREPPAHPDVEQTVEQLRARIRAVLAHLEGFSREDFAGAESRLIPQRLWPGKVVSGQDYLDEMVLPNFYFHLTTAYAILRHNGVDLGKRDFVGSVNLKEG